MAASLQISELTEDNLSSLVTSGYYRRPTAEYYATTEPELKRKLRWALRYVVLSNILWTTIAIVIFYRNHHKSQLLQDSIYLESCCKCWTIANDAAYNGPQLEFSHCLNDCSCNLCSDQYDQYLSWYIAFDLL